MSDQQETVTIHAARRDKDGTIWFQRNQDGGWRLSLVGADQFPSVADLEDAWGPTRPVRIVTTDPAGLAMELTDAEKAAFLAADRELNGPAGLTAEQEIRARALDAAAKARGEGGIRLDETVRCVLYLAQRFEPWIRDGSVPDAK